MMDDSSEETRVVETEKTTDETMDPRMEQKTASRMVQKKERWRERVSAQKLERKKVSK